MTKEMKNVWYHVWHFPFVLLFWHFKIFSILSGNASVMRRYKILIISCSSRWMGPTSFQTVYHHSLSKRRMTATVHALRCIFKSGWPMGGVRHQSFSVDGSTCTVIPTLRLRRFIAWSNERRREVESSPTPCIYSWTTAFERTKTLVHIISRVDDRTWCLQGDHVVIPPSGSYSFRERPSG